MRAKQRTYACVYACLYVCAALFLFYVNIQIYSAPTHVHNVARIRAALLL